MPLSRFATSWSSAADRAPFVSTWPLRVATALAATLAVAVAAHIVFPLPFTPVPFTLQPLAVLAVGLFLGPIDGTLTMMAYLAEGASGLPVFSPTGLGGCAQLLGPTGGFLLAYPLVAYVCGLSRRFVPRWGAFRAPFVGCFLATCLLFTAGAAWFGHAMRLPANAVWMGAVAPFLPGEFIKILAVAGIFRSLHPRPDDRF